MLILNKFCVLINCNVTVPINLIQFVHSGENCAEQNAGRSKSFWRIENSSGHQRSKYSFGIATLNLNVLLSIVKDAMDTTLKSDHSHTSLKNEHGNYPKWLSKRKIAQMKKVKQKKKVTKKQNQKKSKV